MNNTPVGCTFTNLQAKETPELMLKEKCAAFWIIVQRILIDLEVWSTRKNPLLFFSGLKTLHGNPNNTPK
ncbi:MAG TPA: hypothetical protein VLT51_06085 [Anaerolineales bacterium]|nr:hypothetical protein [Anaerolineales bacterium]